MDKLQPIEITSLSDNSYRVRFQTSTGTVDFVFAIENTTLGEEKFSTVAWDPEYSKLVGGDPAALALNQALFNFHEARSFNYECQ